MLATGTRLGPYEILAPLGAGGRKRSTGRRTRGSSDLASLRYARRWTASQETA